MSAKRKISRIFQVQCEQGIRYSVLARILCHPISPQDEITTYCTDHGIPLTRVDEHTFRLQNGAHLLLI
ncbi:MAG: hypothetical protein GY822_24310 [Deltaproteobacteria bacterium]|nr:hypothetical protein [Deltaproteobacteria bacterium]